MTVAGSFKEGKIQENKKAALRPWVTVPFQHSNTCESQNYFYFSFFIFSKLSVMGIEENIRQTGMLGIPQTIPP